MRPRSIYSPQRLGSTSRLLISLLVKGGVGGFRLQCGTLVVWSRRDKARGGRTTSSSRTKLRMKYRTSSALHASKNLLLPPLGTCATRLPTPHPAMHRAHVSPPHQSGNPGRAHDRGASLTLSSPTPAPASRSLSGLTAHAAARLSYVLRGGSVPQVGLYGKVLLVTVLVLRYAHHFPHPARHHMTMPSLISTPPLLPCLLPSFSRTHNPPDPSLLTT